MTAAEIKEIINKELQTEPDPANVFGLDMTKCLLEPVKQKYRKADDATVTYELWTVLEESEDKSGYKIYFDEEVNMFGLAIPSGTSELIDIGRYGDFLKTLYSM
ncbi:hypothetical protein [Ferruginibacter albus]|uniref:hypothetical protein n=1 Tax=Ferruginibacter albus TaxID=2875540 RepID=UPI001CC5B417|nr:hypothetical protein [Ferruginibacter albus]UAY53298.1 hypothetical protein K9M53_06410 [Ferruginibacter albus]